MRQNRKHLVRKPGFGSIRRQQHHVCTRCHTDFRRIRGSSAWSEMENEIYQLHFQTCHNQPAPQSSKRALKMSHSRPEAHEWLCVTTPATRKATAAQRRPRVLQVLLKALCTAPATRKETTAQRRPRVLQDLLKALCTTPATRKETTAQRRPRVHQLLLQALFTAPARAPSPPARCVYRPATKGNRGPAAPTRPPHPPEGSVSWPAT